MGVIVKKTKKNGACKIEVEGEMNIVSAMRLKEELFESFEDYNGIELNLQNVSEIDTSGFQLIVLLKMETNKRNRSFVLTKISEPVKSVFSLYRMEGFD